MADIMETVSGVATTLEPASLTGWLSSETFTKLAFFGKVAFWLIIVSFGVLLIWKYFFQFRIDVKIKKQIGAGAIELVNDKAKIVTDKQNKKKLQLFKTRFGNIPVTSPIPEAKYKQKCGKRDLYEFFMDDNGQLHPIELDHDFENDHRLKVRPQERDAWARMEQKLLEEKIRKKDWYEKYMPSIIVLAAFLVAFLIFFFMSKELAAALLQVASSCTEFRNG